MKYFFCLLFLLTGIAKAQFVSVPYTMHTPAGNVGMTQQVYMPTHYSNRNSNPKFDFEVTLTNDSVINVRSRILSEKKEKKLYVELKKDNAKRQIFPSETKQIAATVETGRLVGMPTDSCWLFHIVQGYINCYSSIPTNNDYATIAIQNGNGKIVPLTRENLKAMIDIEDKKISKLIRQGWFAEAIRRYNKIGY